MNQGFFVGCVSPLDVRYRVPCSGRAPLKPERSPETPAEPQGLEVLVNFNWLFNPVGELHFPDKGSGLPIFIVKGDHHA